MVASRSPFAMTCRVHKADIRASAGKNSIFISTSSGNGGIVGILAKGGIMIVERIQFVHFSFNQGNPTSRSDIGLLVQETHRLLWLKHSIDNAWFSAILR